MLFDYEAILRPIKDGGSTNNRTVKIRFEPSQAPS